MNYKELLKPIQLLALDVDGVLTDGKIYYSSSGDILKAFNIKDGYGINKVQKEGIRVAIISADNSESTLHRAKKLNISDIYIGVTNKDEILHKLRKELGISWPEIVFVGDDIKDIPPMKLAGVGVCPSDAVQEVKDIADIVLENPGGNCIRSFCERLVHSKK